MSEFRIATLGIDGKDIEEKYRNELGLDKNNDIQVTFVPIDKMNAYDIMEEPGFQAFLYDIAVHPHKKIQKQEKSDPTTDDKISEEQIILDTMTKENEEKMRAVFYRVDSKKRLNNFVLLPITTDAVNSTIKEDETKSIRSLFPSEISENVNLALQNVSKSENIAPFLHTALRPQILLHDKLTKGVLDRNNQKEINQFLAEQYLEGIKEKSLYTAGHLTRVSTLCGALAKDLSWNEEQVESAAYIRKNT
ncbi:MAG: hypothetical protein IJ215_00985 [Clostridia bacterium]|nr:hypothetical protein [Clostridia bacterium]